MTQAEIQDLFSDGPCVVCYNDHQLLQIIAILAWKNFSGDVPMTSTDIQDLFNESPCVNCYNDHQLLQLITMLTSAGGGGSGNVIFMTTAPATPASDPPADPALGAIAYIADSGAFIGWNVTTQQWDL